MDGQPCRKRALSATLLGYDGLSAARLGRAASTASMIQGRLIAEADAEGQTLREYVYLEGEPLAVVLQEPNASQCSGTDPLISGEVVGAGQIYYCQASGSITADDGGLQVDTGGEAILAAPLTVLRSGLRVVLGGAFGVGPEATPPTGGVLYFIHPDHLGTPRLVSDANQAIVWRWDSSPFGECAPEEDPDGDGQPFVLNLRFPGQYFDQEAGLRYNYFRDYDAATGRYVESDPVGLEGGNSYAYAALSPLRYTDALGLWVKLCSRKLGDKNKPPATPQINPPRHDYLNVSGTFVGFYAGENIWWSEGDVRIGQDVKLDDGRCHATICDDDNFR